ELAKWAKEKFDLDNTPNQATLSRILAKQDEYLKMNDKKDLRIKRYHQVLQPQLYEALANWVLQYQAKRIYLTEELIYEKGRKLVKQL
ncbi:10261_t:CDS:1, partial [Racocetra persica]